MTGNHSIEDLSRMTDRAFSLINKEGQEAFTMDLLADNLSLEPLSPADSAGDRESMLDLVIRKQMDITIERFDKSLKEHLNSIPDQRYLYILFVDILYDLFDEYPHTMELLLDYILKSLLKDGYVKVLSRRVMNFPGLPFMHAPQEFFKERLVFLYTIMGLARSMRMGKDDVDKKKFQDIAHMTWKKLFRIDEDGCD